MRAVSYSLFTAETTDPHHHPKQTYQDPEPNTSLRSRHSRDFFDRRGGHEQITSTGGYDDGTQDRQSTRPIRSPPPRTSRRPPSLERQDAFAITRTRKDCQIQRRNLASSGRPLCARQQLKGVGTHGLIIINGVLMLQEEALLPRWFDISATQPLGKRRRGGLVEDYAKKCDMKRRRRGENVDRGSPDQPSGFWPSYDTAENSN